jgi:hypothetical protein
LTVCIIGLRSLAPRKFEVRDVRRRDRPYELEPVQIILDEGSVTDAAEAMNLSSLDDQDVSRADFEFLYGRLITTIKPLVAVRSSAMTSSNPA